ncbi:MAG: hypothetical protein HVN35_03640 [Methanobacteriaceae archaeon]|nr:hypothetical protein [Methanobacteriaceae archaeon]
MEIRFYSDGYFPDPSGEAKNIHTLAVCQKKPIRKISIQTALNGSCWWITCGLKLEEKHLH